jgi:2-haloacid dehalogenase
MRALQMRCITSRFYGVYGIFLRLKVDELIVQEFDVLNAKQDGFFSDSRSAIKEDSSISPDDCIQFILFDVFGTVVDWRGTMVQEFAILFEQKGISQVQCDEFIEIWVNAYSDNMKNISEGASDFATVDELNKIALNQTLLHYQIDNKFSEDERAHMWMIWHRLEPWPDSVSGLNKLKELFKIGTLSNGNIQLLADLSKNAHLEWDIILSGELFGCYKPNPMVYQSAARELALNPSEILLVASHKYDLEAAQQCGYKTAYIYRPFEFNTIKEEQIPRDNEFDFVAEGIDGLAEQLRLNAAEQRDRSLTSIKVL